jgi:hypothetical protein
MGLERQREGLLDKVIHIPHRGKPGAHPPAKILFVWQDRFHKPDFLGCLGFLHPFLYL